MPSVPCGVAVACGFAMRCTAARARYGLIARARLLDDVLRRRVELLRSAPAPWRPAAARRRCASSRRRPGTADPAWSRRTPCAGSSTYSVGVPAGDEIGTLERLLAHDQLDDPAVVVALDVFPDRRHAQLGQFVVRRSGRSAARMLSLPSRIHSGFCDFALDQSQPHMPSISPRSIASAMSSVPL